MFRRLAEELTTSTVDGRQVVFDKHPLELAQLLEHAFQEGRAASPPTQAPLGHPDHRSDLQPFLVQSSSGPGQPVPVPRRIRHPWDHLIYAYMTENTRIYEIFRRVLFELLHGEKLGTPFPESQPWLRTTEALFYKDTIPFQINSVTSDIRKDLGGTGRNAYQRMFGMDLNHGGDDGKPYPYVKTGAANGEFVATFEELLREVWVGITYVNAINSSNPTDNSKISELAEKLHDMLLSRRQYGNLSREEFALVSMMSWFHMTVEYNSPIVESLRAEATGVEQRLFKIAERVSLPAHGLSKNFFDIADPMSTLLIEIEKGRFNQTSDAQQLYSPTIGGQPNPFEPILRTIITHWTAITGRDVKARKVAAS